jgi:hypothetical protein
MITRLKARTGSVQVVSAGGAETSVTYTVPIGQAISITHAYAFHNDAVARNCWWEKDTGAGFGVTGSDLTQIEFGIVSGQFRQLCDAANLQMSVKTGQPLQLRAGQSIRWSVHAKTLGAVLTMRLLVDRYLGETPYDS